jgi:predicted nucleotidyltransferase component of viral defense system
VLKGGTALNLFVFDVPRLSVDIDLNYIGSSDKAVMDAERPLVEQAIAAVAGREGFAVRRVPHEHAGGKWYLRYSSALGQSANLEVDLNFMFRTPLARRL